MKNRKWEDVAKEHLEWTKKVFPKSTSRGALLHAKREIDETIADIDNSVDNETKVTEYADIICCVISSADKEGISPEDIVNAMYNKLQVNKEREWKDNGDGSYSHIKKDPKLQGLVVEFEDGTRSDGKYIGLFYNNDFKGCICQVGDYMEYTGRDHTGNRKITFIGLLETYGDSKSAIAIYPIEKVSRVYKQ